MWRSGLSATAAGGLFGRGAGAGWLKNIFAANTDMVFGVVCEELGLIVALCCVLSLLLLAVFSVRSAAAFLVFTLLYMPCVAAVAAIRRELDSVWKTFGVVVFQCLLAWGLGAAVYQIALLI